MSTGTIEKPQDTQGTRMSGPQIYGAIARVKRAMPAVGKSHTAEGRFKYDYRSAEDVMNAAGPLLDKEGIIMVPHVQQMTRELRGGADGKSAMTFVTMEILVTFFAEDGSHIDARVIGEAMDVSDKACTKAQTVGVRIALCAVLNIATADTSSDPESGPQHEDVPQSLASRATTWMRSAPTAAEFKKALLYVIQCSNGQGRKGEVMSTTEFVSLKPVAMEAARRLRLTEEALEWISSRFEGPNEHEGSEPDSADQRDVTMEQEPVRIGELELLFQQVTPENVEKILRELVPTFATVSSEDQEKLRILMVDQRHPGFQQWLAIELANQTEMPGELRNLSALAAGGLVEDQTRLVLYHRAQARMKAGAA